MEVSPSKLKISKIKKKAKQNIFIAGSIPSKVSDYKGNTKKD